MRDRRARSQYGRVHASGRDPRPLLPAGPLQPERFHVGRQRRSGCGRAARRQVRQPAGLRLRLRRHSGRRQPSAHGREHRQERLRLRPHPPLRRLQGHPVFLQPTALAPLASARGSPASAIAVRRFGGSRPAGAGDHGRGAAAQPAGSAERPGSGSCRRGTDQRHPALRTGRFRPRRRPTSGYCRQAGRGAERRRPCRRGGRGHLESIAGLADAGARPGATRPPTGPVGQSRGTRRHAPRRLGRCGGRRHGRRTLGGAAGHEGRRDRAGGVGSSGGVRSPGRRVRLVRPAAEPAERLRRSLKSAFDPRGILNPLVPLAPDGSQAR